MDIIGLGQLCFCMLVLLCLVCFSQQWLGNLIILTALITIRDQCIVLNGNFAICLYRDIGFA